MIDESADNDLFIAFQSDMRNATVKFQQQIMSARLFDLPCVVEVNYSIIQVIYCNIKRTTV